LPCSRVFPSIGHRSLT